MATGASPDDHAADVAWHKANGAGGYDLAAHQALLAFLQPVSGHVRLPLPPSPRPSPCSLPPGTSITLRRLACWKTPASATPTTTWHCPAGSPVPSTGHPGLTDSLRLLKGDPSLLREANAPELLVVRPRHFVLARGDSATVDVHLVNENNLHGPYQLRVTAAMTGRKTLLCGRVSGRRHRRRSLRSTAQSGIVLTPKAAGPVTFTQPCPPHMPCLF